LGFGALTFELASEANDCQLNFPGSWFYVMIDNDHLLPSAQTIIRTHSPTIYIDFSRKPYCPKQSYCWDKEGLCWDKEGLQSVKEL
jgi:hypothetical protein